MGRKRQVKFALGAVLVIVATAGLAHYSGILNRAQPDPVPAEVPTPVLNWREPLPDPADDWPLPAMAMARLGTLRFRIPGGFGKPIFTPDGKQIATVTSYGSVRLWDAASGKLLRELVGSRQLIYQLAFCADSRLKAVSTDESGGSNQEFLVMTWDQRGELVGKFTVQRAYYQRPPYRGTIAVSQNGDKLAVTETEFDRNERDYFSFVRVLDATTGAEVQRFPRQRGTSYLALSADGKRLAVRGPKRNIQLWEIDAGDSLGEIENTAADTDVLSFSGDGSLLAAESGRCLSIYDVARRKVLNQILDLPVASMTFSPDGRKLLVSSNGGLRLWASTGKDVVRMETNGNGFWHVTFSPDGQRAVGHQAGDILRVWNVQTGRPLGQGPTRPASYLQFSPDGRLLASAEFSEMFLWDVPGRKPLRYCLSPMGAGYTGLTFSPDSRTIAAPVRGNHVMRWEAKSGKLLGALTQPGISGAAFLPTGKSMLLIGERNEGDGIRILDTEPFIRIRDCESGQGIARIAVPEKVRFSNWALAPDASAVVGVCVPVGRVILPTTREEELANEGRIWELKTGKQIAQFPLPPGIIYALTMTPDRGNVVLAMGNGISVCDATTGEVRQRLGPSRGFPRAVALSPDGRILACTTSPQPAICLWDLANGKQIEHLEDDHGEVLSLAFSPDGKTLASASTDTTILLWDLKRLKK